jgi:transcriptional regulator with XRE-family HTH domain
MAPPDSQPFTNPRKIGRPNVSSWSRPDELQVSSSELSKKGAQRQLVLRMVLPRPLKSLLLTLLRLIKGKGQKEVARKSGLKVDHLSSMERGTTRNPSCEDMALALDAMECTPAEIVIVSASLRALSELDFYEDLGEAAAREEAAAAAAQRVRRRLRTPYVPEPEAGEYPAPYEVALNRAEAGDSWQRLRKIETLEELALVVGAAREHQAWAVVERLCDESERAASKDAGRARDLALAAVLIALGPRAPESWRRCLLAYAAAHLANAFRVPGDHDTADRLLALARRPGAPRQDPDRILDPGRLFDLEASLRRDQRRFDESLALLEQAEAVTRRPEHVALKTAFTLEVMGEYGRVLQILLDLGPRVENHPETRLKTIQRFNLAVALSHVGRHQDAERLLPSVRRLTADDELNAIRFRWLEGRVAAGLGQTEKALAALEDARHRFAKRGMHYDVCLSLLETAALRLELGEHAEVQQLAGDLAPIFAEKGVHEEALKALRLFETAVARQVATADLARGLLAYFLRARYDRGLRFCQEPC